jgi:hypothetical protein
MNAQGQEGPRTVGLLADEEVEKYWPHFEKSLDSVPEIWEVTTKERIYKDLTSGKMQMWGCCEAGVLDVVMLTQIVEMPTGLTEFQCEVLVGRRFLKYWDLIVKTFEESAALVGCSSVVVHTRRAGLAELLERRGYELRTMELIKRLPSVQSKRMN